MSAFKPLEGAHAVLAHDLCEAWASLRDEALGNLNKFEEWHESHLFIGQWKTAGIMWSGHALAGTMKQMPLAHSIASKHCNIIRNAGYSLLLPDTIIRPHRGYTADVLRLHVGLSVPHDKLGCYLEVEGERRNWKEGEALLFDDTAPHFARNLSEQLRLVFLCDVEKISQR